MRRWRNLSLFLLIAFAGCTQLATRQEKEDSFRPFAARHLGGESLRDFLEARTALLVAGARPLGIETRRAQLGVGLKPTDPDGKVDLGSAAAITSDGYFLTAAHCIHRLPVFLVIPQPGGPQAVAARIVWQPPTGTDCDLAVLHVSVALPSAFVLAVDSEVARGNAVVTGGVNGPAGGRLLDVIPAGADAKTGIPATFTLVHDLPLTHGDSGGPLTTLDGKLIGVEVLVRGLYIGPRQGVALRPDVRWLMRVVSEDRRKW